MDERHNFEIYTHTTNPHTTETQYESVFFPGIGTMIITFEDRTYRSNGEVRPVLSFDFDTSKVDIIDSRGNDREIHPYHNDHPDLNNRTEPGDYGHIESPDTFIL